MNGMVEIIMCVCEYLSSPSDSQIPRELLRGKYNYNIYDDLFYF